MTNLNVTYDSMTAAASELRSGQEDMTTILTNLSTLVANLVETGFVTDAASGAYQEQFETFSESTKAAVGALENLAGYLDQAAQVLASTDNDLASAARG